MGHHAEDIYSKKTLEWSYKTYQKCKDLMLISDGSPLSLYGGIELSRVGESDTFQIEQVSSNGQRHFICEFSSLNEEIPEMCWLMSCLVRDAHAKWKWRIAELTKKS